MSRQQIPGDATFRKLCDLAHCEGVATGPDGALWAGDEDGRLYRLDPADGSLEQIAELGCWALGLCLDGDGRVYVCAYDRGEIIRVEAGGESQVYCGGLRNPNWPVFAPDGTLFVSDSGGEDLGDRDGRVVTIPPGGGSFEALDTPPIGYANGMALAENGRLFVVESFVPRILLIDGGGTSVYRELPGTVPDGLALDKEGGLVVTIYQPNRVLRIPPGGGEPDVLLDDWTGQRMLTPTNASYYGPQRRSLAIASLCGWNLYAIDTPWRGQRLAYPHVP